MNNVITLEIEDLNHFYYTDGYSDGLFMEEFNHGKALRKIQDIEESDLLNSYIAGLKAGFKAVKYVPYTWYYEDEI